MVQTIGPRLEHDPRYLDAFGHVIVDEAQHASADGVERENAAHYARIIDAVLGRGGRCAAFTATSYRADGDDLHPALHLRHREVVAHDEAQAPGRIVPVRTVIGAAPLDEAPADAMTAGVERLTADRRAQRERKVAAAIRARLGDAFWDDVVADR